MNKKLLPALIIPLLFGALTACEKKVHYEASDLAYDEEIHLTNPLSESETNSVKKEVLNNTVAIYSKVTGSNKNASFDEDGYLDFLGPISVEGFKNDCGILSNGYSMKTTEGKPVDLMMQQYYINARNKQFFYVSFNGTFHGEKFNVTMGAEEKSDAIEGRLAAIQGLEVDDDFRDEEVQLEQTPEGYLGLYSYTQDETYEHDGKTYAGIEKEQRIFYIDRENNKPVLRKVTYFYQRLVAFDFEKNIPLAKPTFARRDARYVLNFEYDDYDVIPEKYVEEAIAGLNTKEILLDINVDFYKMNSGGELERVGRDNIGFYNLPQPQPTAFGIVDLAKFKTEDSYIRLSGEYYAEGIEVENIRFDKKWSDFLKNLPTGLTIDKIGGVEYLHVNWRTFKFNKQVFLKGTFVPTKSSCSFSIEKCKLEAYDYFSLM